MFGPSCYSRATTLQKTRLGNFRKFQLFQEPESFTAGYLISLDRMGTWEQTATAVAVWTRVIPGQSENAHCFSPAPCSGGREGKMFYICRHFELQPNKLPLLCCIQYQILLVTAANIHMRT